MKRAVLRAVFRVLIGVLVAAQLAVAAHACAGLSNVQPSAAVTTATLTLSAPGETTPADTMALMACCQDADADGQSVISNLCYEHCRFGQQGDQASTVNVPVAYLLLLVGLPWQWFSAATASSPLPSSRLAARRWSGIVAASPCHAILHCVRRT